MTRTDRGLGRVTAVPGWWLDHHLGDVAGAAMYAARRAIAVEPGRRPEYATVLVAGDADHARRALDVLGPAVVAQDVVRVEHDHLVAMALVLPASVAPPAAPPLPPPPAPAAPPVPLPRTDGGGEHRPHRRPRAAATRRRVVAGIVVAALAVIGGRSLGSTGAVAPTVPVELIAWDPASATATVRHDGRVETYVIGASGDQLVLGDWNGDGTRTPALYRPSTGEVWAFDRWADEGEGTGARVLGRYATGGVARVAVAGSHDTVAVDPPTG